MVALPKHTYAQAIKLQPLVAFHLGKLVTIKNIGELTKLSFSGVYHK
jgi:hypothetical protein